MRGITQAAFRSWRPIAGVLMAASLVVSIASGCAARKPPAAPAPSGPSPAQRLAAADALVRAGCLDCLIAAYREFDALRTETSAPEATVGAIRTAALVAYRERELGAVDDGYMTKARDLLSSAVNAAPALAQTVDILDALSATLSGGTRQTYRDAQLAASQRERSNRAAWKALVRDHADEDALSAYTWLALMCGSVEGRTMTRDELAAPIVALRDAPLIAFKRATCFGSAPDRLAPLLEQDSRFGEINYFLGMSLIGARKLDDADARLQKAYDWHPAWPALTQAIANLALTGEEFERAVTFYDKTLEYEPKAPDVMLGKVRALTYLGRHEEAIGVIDQLPERWFLGDARYWRALNEAQLSRLDEAWTDIELSAKLLINAEVPKLAGIIAYRRAQPEVARGKFEESHARNANDCETGFYLGVVLAEQRVWDRAVPVLLENASCIDAAEQKLTEEIATIRASDDPPARQQRQIARREQEITSGLRMRATSWFNTAVAYYNLSQKAEARQFAEKVADDEQFGERAREILSRLTQPK